VLGMVISTVSKLSQHTEKVEFASKKETKQEVKMSSITEATISATAYNLEVALVYIFSFDFSPRIIKAEFSDYIPKILNSYWKKLFRSAISNNAP
jgi:hypothetical protein